MDKFSVVLYDGCTYRKPPGAVHTYMYSGTVHDFIHTILGNAEVAEAIAAHTATLIGLLSVPACHLIKPITVDYNFIEVLPAGTLFDIERKIFTTDSSLLRGSLFSFSMELSNLTSNSNRSLPELIF